MFKRTEIIFLWNVNDKRKGVNFEIQCNKVFFLESVTFGVLHSVHCSNIHTTNQNPIDASA